MDHFPGRDENIKFIWNIFKPPPRTWKNATSETRSYVREASATSTATLAGESSAACFGDGEALTFVTQQRLAKYGIYNQVMIGHVTNAACWPPLRFSGLWVPVSKNKLVALSNLVIDSEWFWSWKDEHPTFRVSKRKRNSRELPNFYRT